MRRFLSHEWDTTNLISDLCGILLRLGAEKSAHFCPLENIAIAFLLEKVALRAEYFGVKRPVLCASFSRKMVENGALLLDFGLFW
jgi:hypothetical protein